MTTSVRKTIARFFSIGANSRNYVLSEPFCSQCVNKLPVVFPAYLKRCTNKGSVFLKVIDHQTYQKVYQTFKKVSVETIEENDETAYFTQLISGSIYDKGFFPISELDYHIEFTKASENSNMMHLSNRNKPTR